MHFPFRASRSLPTELNKVNGPKPVNRKMELMDDLIWQNGTRKAMNWESRIADNNDGGHPRDSPDREREIVKSYWENFWG